MGEFYYPSDEKLAADPVFMQWMKELEADPDIAGAYGLPLARTTGLECWHTSYADGMTPRQAALSDMDHWEAE